MMSTPQSRIWKIAVAVFAASALGACSGSGSSTTTKATVATGPAITQPAGGGSTNAAVTTPPTSAQASTAAAATGGLSGTWSGQYSGAFQGTFTLDWQQSASNLSGSIKLSAPPVTLPINGAVEGSAIHFGTVGSAAVTYTGTISGNTMSGTYQVGPNRGGPWSATKA